MSTIRLSAVLVAVGAPFSLTGFEESAGQPGKSILPYVKGDQVFWDIPDTPANRTKIRQEFEPSKKFKAEQVHVKQADPFVPLTPKTSAENPDAGDDDGDPDGDPEGEDADGDLEGDVTGDKKAGKGNKSNKKK